MIVQISPFPFDHPGGVEQYAETLQRLFPHEIITLSGGEDFPIVEPVGNFPLPCFWRKGFWNNIFPGKKDTHNQRFESQEQSLDSATLETSSGVSTFGNPHSFKGESKLPPLTSFDYEKSDSDIANGPKSLSDISAENTSAIISHIRFAPTAWLAYWIAKRRKIPYIHIEHGTGFLIHSNPFIAWVAKMVDLTIGKWIIRHAEAVVAVSEAGKRWIAETFGREDVHVIYRGFDFPKVARKENTIPKIGFVGRLVPLKNVGGLIEALAEIREETWTCEIVGDGEERSALEKLVKEYKLSHRVKFLGVREHDWIMREFYPTVDIFVNPSLQEGLPTTVIEALGMGCQVIATDVGGTAEIEGILLVDTRNIQSSLKNLIFQSLQGGILKKKYNREFSLENMRGRFLKIFKILR